MGSSKRYETRCNLLGAAATAMASEFHQQARSPGPYDDAEAEYNDEHLLDAARSYVEAHKGVETVMGSLESKSV